MKKNKDTDALKNTLKDFQREVLTLGKIKVNPWEAWIAILVSVGIFFGVVVSVERSSDFVLGCDFYTQECGGLWTHSVVNGELGSVFSSLPKEFGNSFEVPNQVANAIAAVPGFSLFALGFISSALLFGLIWNKLSFVPKREARKASGKRKISGKRGFVSREYMVIFFLAVFLTLVLSSPVSFKARGNFESGFRGFSHVAGAFISNDGILQTGRNIFNRLDSERDLVQDINEEPLEKPSDEFFVSEDTGENISNQMFPLAEENVLLFTGSSKIWRADSSGLAHVYVNDVSNLLSVRKNGVEIWDKSVHSKPDLKMEFFVMPSDEVELIVWNEENLNSNIEVLPLAGN
jgi:hypothetical protein